MSFQLVEQLDPVTVPPNYVAGIGPFPEGTTDADMGDGYHILTIEDDSQFQVTLDNEFCYVSADQLSLYGGPVPG